MNVLVLGGNGYIGSKVVHELVHFGNIVVCTKRVSSNLMRLNDILDEIIMIPASVHSIEFVMQNMNFNYVLNLACNYGKTNVLYDGIIDANIEFPLKVLNSSVEHGIKKFLTIGTGLPDNLNMYSFTKKKFNEFGKFYVEKHGITFISLLLEMFYGADEPKDRFFPSIISKMIKGEVVNTTIGTQHRDIIAADDIIKSIMMMINSSVTGFNEIPVGTGLAPSISEIVDFIWNQTDKKSEINKGAIPMRENEPDCVADVSIIRSIGEWAPIPWKVGLKKMIDVMRMDLSLGNGDRLFENLRVNFESGGGTKSF